MFPVSRYTIIRSRRKSIELEISANANLIVRAPVGVSTQYIESFISQKSAWIIKSMQKMRNRPKVSRKQFVTWEPFLYLGKIYPLRFSRKNSIELTDTHLLFPEDFLPTGKEKLIEWYYAQAINKIPKRVEKYAEILGVKYKSICVMHATKRWGSCGPTGTLNFNWQLIMTPLPVLDYVVVHELAHLRIRDHSQKFWDFVAKFVPNYQKHITWLTDNQHSLAI